jgi:hypothetical protein
VVVGGKYFLPVPEYQFFSLYVSAIFYPALGFGSSARQCRVLTTSGICFLQNSRREFVSTVRSSLIHLNVLALLLLL